MKKQRYLLPSGFLITLLLYVYFIPPVNLFAFIGFYTLVFAVAYTSLHLRFPKNISLLWSVAVCTYLLLRQFKLDTLLTIILFVGVVLSLQMYLQPPSRRRFGK